MNLTEILLLILGLIVVFGGIGLFIWAFMPGYKALEFRNKSAFRNILDGIVGFIKIFLP